MRFLVGVMFSLLILFIAIPFACFAEEQEKLSLSQIITEVPESSKKVLKGAFTKDTIEPWLWILGSTAVLYKYDEDILRDTQNAGRDLGIGNGDGTKTIIHYKDKDILRLPTDKGSWLYFLGDGWMHMSIASGFLLGGEFGGHQQAFNTGVQLVHGMVVSTIFNQTLKRSFGREDPNKKTKDRGAWRPFPSFQEYNSDVAKYDAMPSGHIMTATLTFTILNNNYPEYSHWLLPIGGLWLSALAFQMVNNGVHWASDYPLGIAMGYYIGNIVSGMGKKDKSEKKNSSQFMIYPISSPSGPLLAVNYRF